MGIKYQSAVSYFLPPQLPPNVTFAALRHSCHSCHVTCYYGDYMPPNNKSQLRVIKTCCRTELWACFHGRTVLLSDTVGYNVVIMTDTDSRVLLEITMTS